MAFPTTGVLDSFARANQDPVGAPSWSGPTRPAASSGQLKVVSNQLAASALVGDTAHSYWSQTQFPSWQEGWASVPVLPLAAGGVSITLKSQNPSTASWSAYQWTYTVGTGWRFFIITNVAYTLLSGPFATPVMAAGDSIGFQSIGATQRGWHKPVAGSWTEIASVNNSNVLLYGLPGYAGVEITDLTARVGSFGGGAYVYTPFLGPSRLAGRTW